MIVPFGLRSGRLYEAREVERGITCGCYCPSCKSPLVAKKGTLVAWHFAHHSDVEQKELANCTGRETALHLYAKQAITQAIGKHLRLPDTGGSIQITKGQSEQPIPLTKRRVDVLLEGHPCQYGARVRPNGRPLPLGVEVCVTSPKDEEYQREVAEAGQLSVMELSLLPKEVERKVASHRLDIGWAQAVKQLIFGHSTSNRKWIYRRGK